MRGSGTSAGTFTLFENERRDGADALAWAATLEGGNGRLGMYGFSYQAATQLLALAGALDDGGPTPAALCPTMMGWDVHADWAYECDAFCLAGDVEAFTALRASARVLPLNEEGTAWPTVLERYARYTHYADWLGDALPALANRTIDVPMLHSAAGTARCSRARSPPSRRWRDHAPRSGWSSARGGHIPWGRRTGIVDFGPEASSPIDGEQLHWFDRHLKDHDNGIDQQPPVRLFDTGAKAWRDCAAWPEPTLRTWHLSGRPGLRHADEEFPAAGSGARSTCNRPAAIALSVPWRRRRCCAGPIAVATHALARPLMNVRADTTLGAKVSLPHAVASAFVVGSCGAEAFAFDALARPEIDGLRHRVRVRPYEIKRPLPDDRPARVEIRLRDARVLSAERLSARGSSAATVDRR